MGRQVKRDDRILNVVARVVAFLWPDRWTGTRRGLLFCLIATCGLAGAAVGIIAGVCLTIAGVSL